ncbi:hypothetical protein SRABI98_00970 [Microbacterium sp. Bi98]|uniref:hypothetical protein n=1 Tax=Microbacterium sp. Bi98 TaxID=2821116 RepID=UPI001D746EB4|nr:hypothetical protein [Microbacterium sp. Bi98]CAH0158812.1 hypothetical protein SRABI98_00970 [Microbacterium sp. Bi98]
MTNTRTFHARATGLTISKFSPTGDALPGVVLFAGQTFTVTPEEYELSKDRTGHSWLDLDAQAQTARWGMVKFQEGPAPDGMGIGEDSEFVMFERGMQALKYARGISDPRERALAVKAVWDEYGTYMRDVAPDLR